MLILLCPPESPSPPRSPTGYKCSPLLSLIYGIGAVICPLWIGIVALKNECSTFSPSVLKEPLPRNPTKLTQDLQGQIWDLGGCLVF